MTAGYTRQEISLLPENGQLGRTERGGWVSLARKQAISIEIMGDEQQTSLSLATHMRLCDFAMGTEALVIYSG